MRSVLKWVLLRLSNDRRLPAFHVVIAKSPNLSTVKNDSALVASFIELRVFFLFGNINLEVFLFYRWCASSEVVGLVELNVVLRLSVGHVQCKRLLIRLL